MTAAIAPLASRLVMVEAGLAATCVRDALGRRGTVRYGIFR